MNVEQAQIKLGTIGLSLLLSTIDFHTSRIAEYSWNLDSDAQNAINVHLGCISEIKDTIYDAFYGKVDND